MKVVIALSLVMLAAAGTGPAAAQQTPYFAAIAYAEGSRKVGVAQDNETREEAEQVARYNCRVETGNTEECKIASWVQGGCVGLAVAASGAWGGHYGRTEAEARQNAMAQCANYAKGSPCEPVRTACASKR